MIDRAIPPSLRNGNGPRADADNLAGLPCVIFATLQDSFRTVIVQDKFSNSMLRVYYNTRGYTGGGIVMKSLVAKRSIVAAGHKTSVSLEDAFWQGLKEIARGRNITLSELVAAIDSNRRHGNLSSAIRLFVLEFYRNRLADPKAGRDPAEGHLAMKAEPITHSPEVAISRLP
jgi:predicted DNA-binding ribbon-helix-helix protein